MFLFFFFSGCVFSLGHVSYLKAKTHLIAADTAFGKLLVVAGTAVNIAAFGKEALRSYWAFAAITGEALIVPRVSFVLNRFCAWENIPDVMNNKIREKGNNICKSVVHLHTHVRCFAVLVHQVVLFQVTRSLQSVWHL